MARPAGSSATTAPSLGELTSSETPPEARSGCSVLIYPGPCASGVRHRWLAIQLTDGVAPEGIELMEHQLTREEVVPIVYWQLAHRWQVFILPVLGLCLVIAGVVVLGVDPSDQISWTVMLVLGVVVLVIFAFLVPLTPNRIWKRVKRQFEVRTLWVSEQGIRRITQDSDSLMRWPMFSTTLEQHKMFLLKTAKGPGYFMIPTRAFRSESDEQMFRRLVERYTSAHLQPEVAKS
jgi:hypothetical protein